MPSLYIDTEPKIRWTGNWPKTLRYHKADRYYRVKQAAVHMNLPMRSRDINDCSTTSTAAPVMTTKRALKTKASLSCNEYRGMHHMPANENYMKGK